VESDIVVEVEREEEDEELNPRSSEKPLSFSGCASNSLSSLDQPISSTSPGPREQHVIYSRIASVRRVALVMWRQRLLPHRRLVAPPLRLSLSLCPCRVLRMYAACPLAFPHDTSRRWPPTPLDCSKPCLPYTGGRSYGRDAPTNVRAPSAAVSDHSVYMCSVTFYQTPQPHTCLCLLHGTLGPFVGNC